MCPSIICVVGREPAGQRLLELGDFLAQLPLGQVGQHLGIAGAGDQRVEHRPPGHPKDVGSDARQLHAGVLQQLVQPVRLALAL